MLAKCKEWGTMDKDKTMYEEFHLEQKWPLKVYKACPLFLDYLEREYPLEEEKIYKAFNKKQGAKTQQQNHTTMVWLNPFRAPHFFF